MSTRRNRLVASIITMLLFTCLLHSDLYSQMRSGAAFLKLFPGARTQSMGNIHTAALDDPYALFMNPATGAYLRDWQWSAGYTKWIADMYSASFMIGRKFSFPWSRKTYMGLSFVYLGVPEFDSTDDAAPAASANEMLFAFHLGQPLSFIHDNVSLGINVKYLNSKLDQYKASALIYDVGMLAKSKRINLHNPLFHYGYLAVGGSVLNHGKELKYDQDGTPLPRTWRVGPSLYAGTHKGIQLQLLADYYHILDEGETYGIGAELSISNLFHVSGGYNFGNDLLNKISFGLSIRLDDIWISEKSLLPGENKGLRIDLASIGEGEFFSNVYEGSVTHFPVLPERFRLLTPANEDTVYSSETILEWEQSFDPDLYDDIDYSVIVMQDSQRLATVLTNDLSNLTLEEFKDKAQNDSVFFAVTTENKLTINHLHAGDYYWAVVARDLDDHDRAGKTFEGANISKFTMTSPDVEVKSIAFDYHRYITTDDYQGDLILDIVNNSMADASEIRVWVYDSIDQNDTTVSKQPIYTELIPMIESHGAHQLVFPWYTRIHGRHEITAEIKLESKQEESNSANNILKNSFYTIPKGVFSCPDTVKSLKVSIVSMDLPIITIVTFDSSRYELKKEYYQKEVIEAPLAVLATRMSENRDLHINLQGFIDPNSGETEFELAMRRANSVKDYLLSHGVNSEQIVIMEGEAQPLRYLPSDKQDAQWICEERRKVVITADDDVQEELFKPVRHIDRDLETLPIKFESTIKAAVPYRTVHMVYSGEGIRDSLKLGLAGVNEFPEFVSLSPVKTYLASFLNDTMTYGLSIVDEEGRVFINEEQNTYLETYSQHRKHRFALPMQFADTYPLYNFYWQHIADHLDILSADIDNEIVFEGHACKIGPEHINEKLSMQRALTFEKQFLGYIKESNPRLNTVIVSHLKKNSGYGEQKPLCIERMDGELIMIGDNNTALGRMLNRRIEIVFSLKE
ncbi:PorV/PorQ family protein [candidate division KSB1 bacterium]|nr:PorV/PorQ family protein [candidate division KSB1 bacterium]